MLTRNGPAEGPPWRGTPVWETGLSAGCCSRTLSETHQVGHPHIRWLPARPDDKSRAVDLFVMIITAPMDGPRYTPQVGFHWGGIDERSAASNLRFPPALGAQVLRGSAGQGSTNRRPTSALLLARDFRPPMTLGNMHWPGSRTPAPTGPRPLIDAASHTEPSKLSGRGGQKIGSRSGC
jgi:hypothetical protein